VQFELGNYYHLNNRTNNEELLFKEEENYSYFLKQYQQYVSEYLETLAYCLMPTHFHFLVHITSNQYKALQQAIVTFLSAYTKAINKRFYRYGSLFQPRTKARLIKDQSDLITVMTYIHQNPMRAKIADSLEEW
jgi:putative transposase